MGMNKDGCSRCGTIAKTRKMEGQDICEACALNIQIAREAIVSCPEDGKKMDKELCGSIIIDRCPACSGVWLDANEIKTIVRQAKGRHGSRGAFLLALAAAASIR